MPFSSRDLVKLFEDELPPKLLGVFPTGWQQIGGVILIRLHPRLAPIKRAIGTVLLENIPFCQSVLNHVGSALGEYRIPNVEHLAGLENTETTFTENRCTFTLDPAKVMFSPGNKKERLRFPTLITSTDYVLDMFAGVGQFTIPIGVHGKPTHIESIEKNPVAYGYLVKNINQNNLSAITTPKFGDCRQLASTNKASVVLMGLLPMDFQAFLPTAVNAIKQKGRVYCHFIAESGQASTKLTRALVPFHRPSLSLEPLHITLVKKIRSHLQHYVATIQVEKNDPRLLQGEGVL